MCLLQTFVTHEKRSCVHVSLIINYMRSSETFITSNIPLLSFNTFPSQRLVFEGKNEPFLLENASNLTHEFLFDNLLIKIVIQNSCVKFDEFSGRNGSFFSQKRGAEKRKNKSATMFFVLSLH